MLKLSHFRRPSTLLLALPLCLSLWCHRSNAQPRPDTSIAQNEIIKDEQEDEEVGTFIPNKEVEFDTPQLMVQKGNSYPVYSVAISPDGTQVLTGGSDRTIVLTDIATGRELRHFPGHYSTIHTVTFSPDGRYVASAANGGNVVIWNLATGKSFRRIYPKAGNSNAVAFSPDSRQLLVGNGNNSASLWNVETGQQVQLFIGHSGPIFSVAFSPDGKQILTGSGDKTARLWDAITGKEICRFDGHTESIHSVAFSPDSKQIFTGSSDKTARLWDIATAKEIRSLDQQAAGVNSVAFSSDGKQAITAGADKIAHLWNLSTGTEVRRFSGHNSSIYSVALSRDGQRLVTGSGDRTARLWDVTTGQELRHFEGHTDTVLTTAFSPDGRQVAFGGRNRLAIIWDLTTGQEVRRFAGHTRFVNSIAFSPDGKQLLTGSADKTLRLWDLATGKQIRRFVGHTSSVCKVVFSPNGKQILSSSYDKTARLWDVTSGKEIRRFSGPLANAGNTHTAVFSPDGRQILTAGWDKMAILWDAATGQELKRFLGHQGMVWSAAFSPDGHQVLTGSTDKRAILWDVATGQEVRRFVGHHLIVRSVAFSADGQRVLTGGADGTARLWDKATGQQLRCFEGHSVAITCAVFSPDESQILTCSYDKTARLWDVNSGRTLCSIVGFDNGWAVVDPKGRYDTSTQGTQWLHYVKGMTPIDFDQLKEGFYEPHLLAKAYGLNTEPLRSVPELVKLKLFPEVDLKMAKQGNQLTIYLRDQGGGIGKVALFINGREVTGDARGLTADGRGLTAEGRGLTAEGRGLQADGRGLTADGRGESFSMRVNLEGTTVLPGQKNEVKVVAYNRVGDLASPGAQITWQAPGEMDLAPPRFYAIVAGISDYADPQKIKSLRFAAKDARDMAQAFYIGARQLFQPENVKVRLLTGETKPQGENPDFARVPASKANFQQAFAEVAKIARPQDTIVVYLAGHGITIGQGQSDYRYLTQDAATPELSHSPFKDQWTISSQELADWMLQIKARKQMMILDTCAAGAASPLLLAGRSISSDQTRALERAKDRAGFFVLMGSAPDAESYESSRYNQGLLTYSLLEGMRGRALREDKYIDTATLFHYAEDRVPELAGNLSQTQKPEVCAPRAESFDVGLVTLDERKNIPLAVAQPQVLKPRLSDADSEDAFDTLGLSPKLADALRAVGQNSERGGGMMYVDVDSLPGALSVTGRYSVKDGQITARLTLRRDGKVEGAPLVLEGKATDLPAFAEQLASIIQTTVIKLPTQ